MFAEQESLSSFFERFNSICFLHIRWQTVPRSRSCNMKSTFTETKTTAENE